MCQLYVPGGVGPRFDINGEIVPHSILGSVEQYKKQALKYGDLPKVDIKDFVIFRI